MVKRKRLNIVSANRNSESHVQPREQQSMPPQHEQQSQEQLSSGSVQSQLQTNIGTETQPSSNNIPAKKVRGPTRMSNIWDLPVGQRIRVKANNSCQPILDEFCSLTRFIGTMVRMPDFAPINYKNWHDMPNNKKEEMWKTVKLKFQFQQLDSKEYVDEATMEKVKVWVLLNMSTKWRQWKNELKSKIYDKHQTPGEMVANFHDPQVNINQLKSLASYWLTDKTKGQSETNKTNRSKLDESHCRRARSFLRIIQTLTEESNGAPPTCAGMYIQTCTRKDENIVNDKAARVVELLKQGINESTSQNLEESSWKDDVFSKVKGPNKKGRVCCMKMIATSSSDRSGPSHFQSTHQDEELEGLKVEVQGLKQTLMTVLSIFQKQFPKKMCLI